MWPGGFKAADDQGVTAASRTFLGPQESDVGRWTGHFLCMWTMLNVIKMKYFAAPPPFFFKRCQIKMLCRSITRYIGSVPARTSWNENSSLLNPRRSILSVDGHDWTGLGTVWQCMLPTYSRYIHIPHYWSTKWLHILFSLLIRIIYLQNTENTSATVKQIIRFCYMR